LTVLDAYAVIAYLRAEPAATEVKPLLKRPGAVLTTVGVAEVLDHLIRIVGVDEEDATLDVAQLGLLDGIPVNAALGAAAGRLRARRYHRSRCIVSMADCIAAEAARARAEPLATSDRHLLDLCHAEEIARIALSQSDGSVWVPPPAVS
jgi:PIN domain nuclease of toxin-antitoxin system